MDGGLIMAAYVKESSTVNITLVDAEYQETVFKIDEPRENLTLAECKNAFSTAIAQELLYTRDGVLFTDVSKASIVTTRVVEADLE